jgi:hypothetical protein
VGVRRHDTYSLSHVTHQAEALVCGQQRVATVQHTGQLERHVLHQDALLRLQASPLELHYSLRGRAAAAAANGEEQHHLIVEHRLVHTSGEHLQSVRVPGRRWRSVCHAAHHAESPSSKDTLSTRVWVRHALAEVQIERKEGVQALHHALGLHALGLLLLPTLSRFLFLLGLHA